MFLSSSEKSNNYSGTKNGIKLTVREEIMNYMNYNKSARLFERFTSPGAPRNVRLYLGYVEKQIYTQYRL